MLPPLRPPLDPPTAQQYLDKYVPDCKRNVHIQVWDVAILFSQPWWFHKAFAINGGWWSPGFVRARIGICSKISLSTQSLNRWTGVWNNSRTFYNYLKHSALSTFSLFEEHAQAGFVGVLPVPLKHYIAQGNDGKDCFAIAGYCVHHKIRSPELQTITDASLTRNDQSPSVSNSWRGWSCE